VKSCRNFAASVEKSQLTARFFTQDAAGNALSLVFGIYRMGQKNWHHF